MKNELDVSVITVTWNSADFIARQIQSVETGAAGLRFEQIIVDNDSKDDTVSLIQKSFPSVTILSMGTNAGFGAANNAGAQKSTGEFLLFLNPDMRVQPGSLKTMVEWMRANPTIGLASCKLVDENSVINTEAMPRRFPRLTDQIALILKIPHLFPSVLNTYLYHGFNSDKEQTVESVRGAFMLMRREVYEQLGFAFDPRYFFWFEDVDTCREVWRLGLKVVYTPIISCVDYVGQSFKKRTTVWKQMQFTQSMCTYFKKWEPWYVWIWIAVARPFGIALAWLNDRLATNTK